jgi:hypothetical protein
VVRAEALRAGFGNLHRAISGASADNGQDLAYRSARCWCSGPSSLSPSRPKISTWKDQLLEGAAEVFATSSSAKPIAIMMSRLLQGLLAAEGSKVGRRRGRQAAVLH